MTISGNMHGGLFAEGMRKVCVVVGVEPKRVNTRAEYWCNGNNRGFGTADVGGASTE